MFSHSDWHRYNDSPGVFPPPGTWMFWVLAQDPNTQMVENFGPDLPLLFKLHEIWSVDSQENN